MTEVDIATAGRNMTVAMDKCNNCAGDIAEMLQTNQAENGMMESEYQAAWE